MKYKLNMLYPAIKIFKAISLLLVLDLIALCLKLKFLCLILSLLIIVLLLIITIGILVELRQDDILYQKYIKSRKQSKRIASSYECQYCGARYNINTRTCPICGQTLHSL